MPRSPNGKTAKPASFCETRNERKHALRCVRRGDPLMLIGPTGCGKTTLVADVAAELGLEVETVVCHSDLGVGDLLGRWTLRGDGSAWRDGPLTRAARLGRLAYLDEITAAPTEVLHSLFSLLDHRRQLFLSARPEQVSAHPHFCFVASFNPEGGPSPHRFGAALRQRFTWLRIAYLPPDAEARLLCSETGIDPDAAEYMVRVGEITRSAASDGNSDGAGTRLLLRAASAVKDGEARDDVVLEDVLPALTQESSVEERLIEALCAGGLLGPEHGPGVDHDSWYRHLDSAPLNDDDFYETQDA